MTSNILVNFWDYFTSPPAPEKKIEPEIKGTELKEIHEVIAQKPETPKKAVLSEEEIKEIEKRVDSFDEDFVQLKKLLISSDAILDNESNDTFSITKYDSSIQEIIDLEMIPILIRKDSRYLNLIESAIFLTGKNQLKIPGDINITGRYDSNYKKIKFAVLIALILDININLFFKDQKVEILTKNSVNTVNFLYFNRIFFTLIPHKDFGNSENYTKISLTPSV